MILTGIYLLKGNIRNSRTRCEICSKLTIKTPKLLQWPIVSIDWGAHIVLIIKQSVV